MPFGTKARDFAMPLSQVDELRLEGCFLLCGNLYLLATAASPGRAEASPVRVLEVSRKSGFCSLPLPHDLTFLFFPFSCKRLSFVASRKPGAWQSISPAEPCFLLGHPRRAGCRQGLQRRAAGRRGRRLGSRGLGPGPPLRAALSWEGVSLSTTRTD